MKVLGLTGSIATGKSTVSGMFRAAGVPVICADEIAHDLTKPGKPLLEEIKKEFGREYFNEDDTLNRVRLGALVFNDAAKRARLNALTHPKVRAEMLRQLESYRKRRRKLVVLDIPLLYESGLESLCDQVAVVYAPVFDQKKRLMERNQLGEKEALLRLAAQMSIEEKKLKADYVIDNSGSVEETQRQVHDLIQRFLLALR